MFLILTVSLEIYFLYRSTRLLRRSIVREDLIRTEYGDDNYSDKVYLQYDGEVFRIVLEIPYMHDDYSDESKKYQNNQEIDAKED